MRANEFLKEAIAPIAPLAPVGQDQQAQSIAQARGQQQQKTAPKQEEKDMPIIQGIRQVAAKQPVSKTGNAGIDSLLFDVAGLSSAPGGIAQTAASAVGAIGSAFAKNSRRQNTQFTYKPRSGSDIIKGIPKNEPTTLTPGVADARGLSTSMDNQSRTAGRTELIKKIQDVATMNTTVPRTDPKTEKPLLDQNGNQLMMPAAAANSTKNAGIDNLLDSAGILMSNRQQRQQRQPQTQQPAGTGQQ